MSTRSEAGLARAGGRPAVRALAAVAALMLAIAGCGSSGSGPGTGQSGPPPAS